MFNGVEAELAFPKILRPSPISMCDLISDLIDIRGQFPDRVGWQASGTSLRKYSRVLSQQPT